MLCVTYVLSSVLMNMDYYFYIINVLFSCLWKFRLSPCDIFSLNKRTTNIQKLTEIARCVYIYAVACLILGMGLLIHGSTCCMPITIRIKLPTREKLQNRYIIFHEQRTTQTYIPLLFLFQLVLPIVFLYELLCLGNMNERTTWKQSMILSVFPGSSYMVWDKGY